MAIQSMQLDPNAASYADLSELDSAAASKLAGIDAGAEVNHADLSELDSTANTKLSGIDAGANVNPTDDEVIAAINSATDPITREAALSQDDLNLVKTNPAGGEFPVKNIHRDATGLLDVEYDDVAA